MTSIKPVAGTSVVVSLDNETPTYYFRASDDDDDQRDHALMREVPDALLVVINPAYPPAIDGALRARLEHYGKAMGAAGAAGVVIVKDVGISWEIMMHPKRPYSDEGEAVSLNLSPEEMEGAERVWQERAERGYELAWRPKDGGYRGVLEDGRGG